MADQPKLAGAALGPSSPTSSEPRAIRHIDDGTDRSISSREAIRKKLQSDIEQFLSAGGAVQTIDPHVTADPPTKPISNYGGRPI